MTEVEWLQSKYPSDMLLWVPTERESERKVLLLLVAVTTGVEYSPLAIALAAALGRHAEGLMTHGELDLVYRAAGVETGAPTRFTAENARYSIATSKPARIRACSIIRDIFGNPFRPAAIEQAWRTTSVLALARQMYNTRDFSAMPILGDALEDANCVNADILTHCREEKEHVRGCWVVDLLLGKS